MKKEIISIMLFIVLSLLFFCGCLEINSEVLHVDVNGGGDFKSIQDAIENVVVGGTVYVGEGVYYESLAISKSLNLIGAGDGKTIIMQSNVDSNRDSIIYVDADNCVIKGFSILGYESNFNFNVIGINISSSNNIISNNLIKGSDKGIYLTKTSENNKILNNIFINSSNGIYSFSSDYNNISKNNVSSCTVYGIYIIGSDNNVIFDNILFDNNYGMRIMNSNNNVVSNNSILGNMHGVLCCCSASDNIIYNNTFKKNQLWNAEDEVNNQWDNGFFGNYWDDYIIKYPNASEVNGVWDTSYILNDGVNNDRYPLVNPPFLL